jgi:hypothetical protein
MPDVIEKIVVHASPRDKRAIAAKAKRLSLPVSELMRRAALAYKPRKRDRELAALADAAKAAADRAGAAIDRSLAFIAASNRRIAAMNARAAKAQPRKAG